MRSKYLVTDAYGEREANNLDELLLLPYKGKKREILVMRNKLDEGTKLIHLLDGVIIVDERPSYDPRN